MPRKILEPLLYMRTDGFVYLYSEILQSSEAKRPYGNVRFVNIGYRIET
jgi:hypothetical protein